MESFLQLLKEEKDAVEEFNAGTQSIARLIETEENEILIQEFKKTIEGAERRAKESKDKIKKYLLGDWEGKQKEDTKNQKPEKIEVFVNMLFEEARRENIMKHCCERKINALEALDCVDYLREKLDISII